jgi:hypothetical protein
MKPLYDSLCSQVTQKLGLQVTDFADTFGASSWSSPVASGTAAWLSESSPQYLTGVSFLTKQQQQREDLTINIWMGPSYDVPHCQVTFGTLPDGSCHVSADYVARGANVMGSDPQYLQVYYGSDVQAAWRQAHAAGQSMPARPEFDYRMMQSPAYMAVSGLDAATAEQLVQGHIQRFLSWVETAQQIPARSRGSFNMRDDKLRQFFYRAQLEEQVAALGDGLGQTVAAVNTGPTAEAYVGGGS